MVIEMQRIIFEFLEYVLTKISLLFPNSELAKLFNGETPKEQAHRIVKEKMEMNDTYSNAVFSRGNVILQMPIHNSPDNKIVDKDQLEHSQ